MIIDDRYKQLFTCGTILENVLYTSSSKLCEHLPIHGYYEKMLNYFFKSDDDFDKYCEYVKTCVDYDPTKIFDKEKNTYLNPIITKEHEIYIHKYLEQLKFSFYNYTSQKSYKNMLNLDRETQTLINEEGESITEAEMLEEKGTNKVVKLLKYKEKLPFLLKNLHEKGKRYGISTLSCIRAIMLNPSKDKFTFRSMKMYGIWKMDKVTGECTELLNISSGDFQYYFKHWILGTYKDIFYNDLLEFISICSEIPIDMRNLDPKKYGQSFINKINNIYFIPNHELAARNQAVLCDIYNNYVSVPVKISLIDYLENNVCCYKSEQRDILSVTIETITNKNIITTTIFNEIILENLKKINMLPKKFYFDENGFMVDDCMKLILLNGTILANSDFQVFCKSCIYHVSGTLITLGRKEEDILYLPQTLINMYSDALISGEKIFSVISYEYNGKRKKWGEWC